MFDFLTKLFRKSEQPEKVKKTAKVKAIKHPKQYFYEVNTIKYFNNMADGRKYIQQKYKGQKNLILIVNDLNNKRFRTARHKKFTEKNLKWYLLPEKQYQAQLKRKYDNFLLQKKAGVK